MYNKLIVIFFLKTIIISAENIEYSFQFEINGMRSMRHGVQQNYTMSSKNMSLIPNVTLGASDNFTEATIYEDNKPLSPAVLGDLYLVIPCNATGNPKPEIKWKRNSDFISIDGIKNSLNLDGLLQIKHPNDTINGLYICLAKNMHNDNWIESKIKRIIVLSAPMYMEPTVNITLSEGECRDIQCPLLSSKNISSRDYLRWYKDSQLYSQGSLKLRNVTFRNSGDYLCRISFWDKTESLTAAVRIIVKEGMVIKDSNIENEHNNCETDDGLIPKIEEIVPALKMVVTSRAVISPNTLETIPYTIDLKTEYTIISNSDNNMVLNFTTTIERNNVRWISDAKALKIKPPGDYEVQVKDGGGITSTLTFGETDFIFNYGFSEFKPENFNETSKAPSSEVQLYLAIQVTDNKGDVHIKTAELRDMNNNILKLIPLELICEKEKFYITEKFDPPTEAFTLCIIGQTNSNKTISRSVTPIEVSREINGSTKSPNVFINQGVEFGVDYDRSITLKCKVSAYPKPIITWENLKTGETNTTEVFTQEPYQYLSKLKIDHVIQNNTYLCKATNDYGSDNASIRLYIKSKPYIKDIEIPKDTILPLASTKKIVCKVDTFPIARVIWLKNETILHDTEFIKISILGDSLTIKNMQPELEGNYSCVVNNDFKMKFYHFKVIYGFVSIENITISKSEVEVGDIVLISCEAIGTPTPTVTWYLNDKNIANGDRFQISSNSLRFESRFNDSGIYSCKASNIFGLPMRTVELTVFERPITNSSSSHEKITLKDSRIDIFCPVIGGHPVPTVTWTINNVKSNYTSGVIVFDSVQRSNAGIYVCTASNKYGHASHEIQLIVYSPVDFDSLRGVKTKLNTMEGNDNKLECNPNGYPKPSVTWMFCSTIELVECSEYFHDRISSNGTIYLNNLSIKDSGYYVCIASNLYDSKKFVYEVEVEAKTIIHRENKPLPETVSGDFYLVIPCNATGNPKPEIRWNRNNDNIAIDDFKFSLNSDGSLVIKNPTDAINGNYICLAKNKHDDNWVEGIVKRIRVLSAPTYATNTHPHFDYNLSDGDSLNVPCPLLESKTISSHDYMRWYKDGKHYADGDLRLINVNYGNRGIYYCRISYRNRTDSETASVTIKMTEGKPVFLQDEENSKIIKSTKVKLDCTADGAPRPTVKWTHEGKESIALRKFTHMFDLRPKSHGLYRCIVQNRLGTITREFIV